MLIKIRTSRLFGGASGKRGPLFDDVLSSQVNRPGAWTSPMSAAGVHSAPRHPHEAPAFLLLPGPGGPASSLAVEEEVGATSATSSSAGGPARARPRERSARAPRGAPGPVLTPPGPAAGAAGGGRGVAVLLKAGHRESLGMERFEKIRSLGRGAQVSPAVMPASPPHPPKPPPAPSPPGHLPPPKRLPALTAGGDARRGRSSSSRGRATGRSSSSSGSSWRTRRRRTRRT